MQARNTTSLPLTFHTAWWKSASVLIGGLLFGLPAACTGIRDDNPWMIASANFFGLVVLAGLVLLLRRPAELTIDAQGVGFSHGRVEWFVPWKDVTEVRLFTIRSHGIPTQRNVIIHDCRRGDRVISSGLTISAKALHGLISDWAQSGPLIER
ncbi:hypothetical protein PQ455_03350 [Sphingomonas naphthae]|uniref:PH domain-containing protein n=1 Tax=Sphingomonas naphthae TaxID=1813468 RepID=A0ABY7TMM4_9SPHN|nr:hypothetical protein [Sphingomonas naphthae]WCT74278.1 hypothetical protein PQ455_03350 [Sphingomonas naphthae]